MWSLERNTEFTHSSLNVALMPCSDSKGIAKFHFQQERRPDFPEAKLASPSGSHHNARIPPSFKPQLPINHEILHSTQQDALFCCSVLREVPHSLFKLERILGTL